MRVKKLPLPALLLLLSVTFFGIFLVLIEKREEVIVHIPKGLTAKEIAKILKKEGIIEDELGFFLLLRIKNAERKLISGWYRMKRGIEPEEVIDILTRGKRVMVPVSIPPGSNLREIAGIVEKALGIDSLEFLKLAHDKRFMEECGVYDAPSLEGYIYPETYVFAKGEDARFVLRVMVKRMFEVLDDSIPLRAGEMGLNIHQLLTIASLIEEEAQVDEERPIIASVIYNRLKRGMPLQIDATVQYALPHHKPRLFYKDLRIESPYNTYLHRGLPPGPIASPGIKSIRAAIHPARTDYLYYVSRGDGTHIFTRTAREHINAKRRVKRKWKRGGS